MIFHELRGWLGEATLPSESNLATKTKSVPALSTRDDAVSYLQLTDVVCVYKARPNSSRTDRNRKNQSRAYQRALIRSKRTAIQLGGRDDRMEGEEFQ